MVKQVNCNKALLKRKTKLGCFTKREIERFLDYYFIFIFCDVSLLSVSEEERKKTMCKSVHKFTIKNPVCNK